LLSALRRGRLAVEKHMIDRRRQGLDHWNEQTATDLLCSAAHPALRYIPFTTRQEAVVGADWLWWWVGESGECLGLLLQAKNLCRVGSGWSIDFGYRRGTQMRTLFEAAEILQVPPGYILYCGDRVYRRGLNCEGCQGDDIVCAQRERAAVTLVTALVVYYILGREWRRPSEAAVAAFHHSIPIEDLADPGTPQPPIMDLNLRSLNSSLREFLMRPQSGVRRVARHIFADVSRTRSPMFAAAVAEKVESDSSVFSNLPADMGHFGLPYFPHVLRGLRSAIPTYVETIALGGGRPEWMPPNVAGIVIATV